MELNDILECPKCKGKKFTINREVTYIYKYNINSEDINTSKNNKESLPFVFDDREKLKSKEFICCDNCKTEYNITLNSLNNSIDFTIIKKAIRSDIVDNPEFIG